MAFVYVACAIDLADGDQAVGEEVAKALVSYGHGVYRPWRALEFHGPPLERSAPIRAINMAVIEQVDALVAVVGMTMSIGTVMDLVYAFGLSKPVYVLLAPECAKVPYYLWDFDVYRYLEDVIRAVTRQEADDDD
jgi:nucleoside 2-deoxyribosyltransferase